MGSQQGTVDFLVDQFAAAGLVAARKMFGEYAIYCEKAPPYPQAKPWYVVPEEQWDEREWLCGLARVTAAALPPPAPKKKKAAR